MKSTYKKAGTLLISVFITLFSFSTAKAQDTNRSKLVLRGIALDPGTPYVEDGQEFNQRTIMMEFVNNSDRPVILINPTLAFGTGLLNTAFFFRVCGPDYEGGWDLSAFKIPAKNHKKNLAPFRDFALDFDRDRPPPNLTTIVEPGKSFRFEESIAYPIISHSWLTPIHPAVKGDIPKNTCSNTDRPDFFVLEYEFSFLPYVEDPDFLEKLSTRWRRFGDLPVGKNGTYYFFSEQIPFDR